MSFCRSLCGQKLIKLQYETAEKFVITLTSVIIKLNPMVPAKWSSEVCNFHMKYNGDIIRGNMPNSQGCILPPCPEKKFMKGFNLMPLSYFQK